MLSLGETSTRTAVRVCSSNTFRLPAAVFGGARTAVPQQRARARGNHRIAPEGEAKGTRRALAAGRGVARGERAGSASTRLRLTLLRGNIGCEPVG